MTMGTTYSPLSAETRFIGPSATMSLTAPLTTCTSKFSVCAFIRSTSSIPVTPSGNPG